MKLERKVKFVSFCSFKGKKGSIQRMYLVGLFSWQLSRESSNLPS